MAGTDLRAAGQQQAATFYSDIAELLKDVGIFFFFFSLGNKEPATNSTTFSFAS